MREKKNSSDVLFKNNEEETLTLKKMIMYTCLSFNFLQNEKKNQFQIEFKQ